MNKGLIIALVVGIAALTAVGGYFLVNRSTNTPQTIQNQTQEIAMEETNTPKSLKSLFSMTANQQCSFTDTDTQSNGIVYIGNGKVRGDFATNSEGTTYNSNMISDGEKVYIWVEGMNTGYSISLDAIESFNTGETENAPNLDFENDADFDCSTWNPDANMFNLPSEVEFQDFTGFIPTNVDTEQVQLPDVETSCEVCDQLPAGEAQDACRASLDC